MYVLNITYATDTFPGCVVMAKAYRLLTFATAYVLYSPCVLKHLFNKYLGSCRKSVNRFAEELTLSAETISTNRARIREEDANEK
jgi:hypothetical protein